MNTFQTAFSSARFNRLMIGVGAIILTAGVLFLVSSVVGGSDKTSYGPDAGFQPNLPVHSEPLKNADGRTIRTFWQLDPEVRSTIRTFLGTAVARKNLGRSWAVVAPSVKTGYTYETWKNAKALPVIPYPIDSIEGVQYYLDYASTQEILIEVGVSSDLKERLRPTTFQLGLVPVGKGAETEWLVDYWMPRWTPPLRSGD